MRSIESKTIWIEVTLVIDHTSENRHSKLPGEFLGISIEYQEKAAAGSRY